MGNNPGGVLTKLPYLPLPILGILLPHYPSSLLSRMWPQCSSVPTSWIRKISSGNLTPSWCSTGAMKMERESSRWHPPGTCTSGRAGRPQPPLRTLLCGPDALIKPMWRPGIATWRLCHLGVLSNGGCCVCPREYKTGPGQRRFILHNPATPPTPNSEHPQRFPNCTPDQAVL